MINLSSNILFTDSHFSNAEEIYSRFSNGEKPLLYLSEPMKLEYPNMVLIPQVVSVEDVNNASGVIYLTSSFVGYFADGGEDYFPYEMSELSIYYANIIIYGDFTVEFSFSGRREVTSELFPCLIAGTQITMADGTTKAIEDVKRGEEILSYDPANNQQVSAVVFGAYKTGSESKFDSYIFNDGSNLVIYDTHGYYDTNARTIRDFKAKGTYTAALNQEGENVRVVSIRPYYHYGDKVNRYNLISSNNMYYANGILCGSKPVNKYSYVKRVGIKTPDNIKNILTADCDEYNAYNDLFQNPEYLKRTATLRTEYHDAHAAVVRKKEALANLDYKTIKVAEGVAGADTLEDVIPVKNRLRSEIDENRAIYHNCLAQIKEIENEMRGDVREQTVFETCCTRDNNAFEEFKSWLNPSK